jgi:hypothetical protein
VKRRRARWQRRSRRRQRVGRREEVRRQRAQARWRQARASALCAGDQGGYCRGRDIHGDHAQPRKSREQRERRVAHAAANVEQRKDAGVAVLRSDSKARELALQPVTVAEKTGAMRTVKFLPGVRLHAAMRRACDPWERERESDSQRLMSARPTIL